MLTVKCPSCGSYNDETAAVCYSCQSPLAVAPSQAGKIIPPAGAGTGPAGRRRAAALERPGCVSIYALWFFLSGLGGMVSLLAILGDSSAFSPAALSAQLESAGGVDPEFFRVFTAYLGFVLIALLIGSVLNLVVGWGLWAMKNWARVYILVTQGLSILFSVAILFFSIAISRGSLCVGALYLVPIVIAGYIFLWFMEHRASFR